MTMRTEGNPHPGYWRKVDIYAPICNVTGGQCRRPSDVYDGTDPTRFACRDHTHLVDMPCMLPKPKIMQIEETEPKLNES